MDIFVAILKLVGLILIVFSVGYSLYSLANYDITKLDEDQEQAKKDLF
jgi:hypothetical protein